VTKSLRDLPSARVNRNSIAGSDLTSSSSRRWIRFLASAAADEAEHRVNILATFSF
jgi:hypothetical protein